jgi:predicted ribosome quality control (RQC) complex YloA/Tae2 family protein
MDARTSFHPLSSSEVALIAQKLQALVGAQLQECAQTSLNHDTEFGLAFYHNGSVLWLWVALRPSASVVLRCHDKPPGKKLQRPLTLFLRSRFLGRRLAKVSVLTEGERVLVFSFFRGKDEDDASPCEIEVRLLPHGQNVIARDGERAVSELKPKNLPLAGPPSEIGAGVGAGVGQMRSWEQIEEQWRALNQPLASAAAAAVVPVMSAGEREWRKELEKKVKILQRLEEEIKTKSSSDFSELGEWLKVHGTLGVPEKWRHLINIDKALSWNIEESFRRAKENARKLSGTRTRFAVVTKELEDLKKKGAGAVPSRTPQKRRENLLVRGEARGRRFQVADDLEAFVGKSAEDNLRILRKAQPFDYWMHLRERPGSHAILRRTRGRVVSDLEFLKVGVWVAEQSLKKRASELKGERYDLLIVECRFVRPIKGDKLGRVHYTHDRVLTIRF